MLGEAACSVCMFFMLTQLDHSPVRITDVMVHHMVLDEADFDEKYICPCHFADKLSC